MVDFDISPMPLEEDSDSDLYPDSRKQRAWERGDVRLEDRRATKYVRPVDQVYVRPVCHRQTGTQRFGPQAKECIDSFLYEHYIVSSNESGGANSDSEGPANDEGLDELSPTPEGSDDGDENEEGEDVDDQTVEPPGLPFGNGGFPDDGLNTFPRLQRARNGLTALSQRFNLYFAAYQDKIYVYRPQQPPQILPDESLILRPKRSAVAKRVGGCQNRVFGHQVNHLIVGELGDLEVLLFCYDDGDVVAYYTHQIAQHIVERDSNHHVQLPRQFFHSNVGKSAWGLAIHKQSRLLAVTCNKHEVTVFAFSITDYQDGYNPAESDEDEKGSGWARPVLTAELEKHFQSRTRTWHIILSVSNKGKNMPNVAFCDDADGNAEKVVAVDIGGNIWIINIWKLGSSPVVYPEPNFARSRSPTGWGVLILSDSDFKPANSYCEALGLPKNQIMTSPRQLGKDGVEWWDTTCSLFYLRDSALDQHDRLADLYPRHYEYHLHSLPVNRQWPDGGSSWVYPEESECQNAAEPGPAKLARHTSGHKSIAIGSLSSGNNDTTPDAGEDASDNAGAEDADDEPGPWALFTDFERKEKINFARIIAPGPGHLSRSDMSPDSFKQLLDGDNSRRDETNALSYKDAQASPYHSKMSIFYTDQCGIELHPLDFKTGPGIRCENVLSYYNHQESVHPYAHEPWDLQSGTSERISMVNHVRELNLVVCGSLCGRVALVTLTKARRYHADMPFQHGFRVDVVLPRRAEEDKRIRPRAPLHGMAVSAVPDHKARKLDLHRLEHGGRPAMASRVYRLMLHYLDHSILLYHFTRSEKDGEVLVF
ncbi:hypothetical protein GQ53DRAFT_824087 [Thozetella sp. PMI_491]|nr:hypothetical protein GQ53DRAFT_824087 [Thozetella sp. PMI_491]